MAVNVAETIIFHADSDARSVLTTTPTDSEPSNWAVALDGHAGQIPQRAFDRAPAGLSPLRDPASETRRHRVVGSFRAAYTPARDEPQEHPLQWRYSGDARTHSVEVGKPR